MKSMPNLSQASSITRSSSLTDASTKIVNGATDVDVETILATIGKVDAENVIKEVEEVLEKLGGKLSADAGHVTEKKGRWDRLFGRVKRG